VLKYVQGGKSRAALVASPVLVVVLKRASHVLYPGLPVLIPLKSADNTRPRDGRYNRRANPQVGEPIVELFIPARASPTLFFIRSFHQWSVQSANPSPTVKPGS
jgi:hypothetical protein